MSDVPATAVVPEAAQPPSIEVRELWPWAVFAGALLLVLVYLVGVDQGAAGVIPGRLLHEYLHDGRHLLAFPCH
jgi:Probable cobalt transporter subunit (CbtB)